MRSPPTSRKRAARLIEPLEPRLLFAAGSIDTSFGFNGELAVRFPNGQAITVVRDSLVQPDGKILVTGEAVDTSGLGGSDFALARLNPDGSPDTSFNNGAGIFVYHSPGDFDEGSGVALQSDGKIVVSATFGEDRAGVPDYSLFAVGRFNADGTLDTGFGDQGAIDINYTTTATTAQEGSAHDVLVGPDDKITLIGYASADPSQAGSQIALARLNPDGSFDTTFGTGGKVLTSVLGDSELAFSAAFDAAGNILVTGGAGNVGGNDAHFFTARFLPTGAVDGSFGSGGAVTTDFFQSGDMFALSAGDAVAVQADGKIVVGGLSAHADANGTLTAAGFALARYNPDGSVDSRFANGGQIESDFGQITSINKLLIDPTCRIIASGLAAPTAADANNHVFNPIVAQYTTRGQLDPSFGNGGSVIINVNGAATPGAVIAPAARATLSAAAAQIGVRPAAATTTSQQVGAVLQRQSAIVVALGDRLLVITTSSDSQLTATRLIGNGADLAAGVVTGIKVNSVLGGAKGAVVIPVSNVGNDPLTGTATVTLFLSTDPTADAGDTSTGGGTYRLNLKPGRAKSLKLKFNYSTGLPDGAYYLIAVVDPGPADVNASNDAGASAAPVTVARPFVTLDGSVAPPPPLTDGKKAKLILDLQDGGNVPAKGLVTVTVYASTDAVFDAGDVPLGAPGRLKLGLKPGRAKAGKVSLLIPADLAAGPYFLIAVLDDSALAGATAASLTLTSATQATVS